MSQLIKKLRQVSESTAPSLGFKTAAASSARPMLLIAVVSEGDLSGLAGITEAKVDAVMVLSQDLKKDIETFKTMAKDLGDIPWGIQPESIAGEDIKELIEAGGDFVTFAASKAPAALLEEETGKVIRLSLPLDDGLIKTIDQMPIDTILLDLRGEGGTLTVSHLIECQRLSLSTRKPVMTAVDLKLDNRDLQALWEAGINGVAVEAKTELKPELLRLHQAIEAISKTPRKSGERRTMLPRLNG